MKYNVLSISVSGNIDKVQAVRRLVAKKVCPLRAGGPDFKSSRRSTWQQGHTLLNAFVEFQNCKIWSL